MKKPFPNLGGRADPWLPEIEIRLQGQTQEIVAIAYLDAEEEMLALRLSTQGAPGEVHLPLRDILRDVLDNEPAALVLAHNHPSGDPRPSPSDQRATQTLCAVLRPLGVNLADHIILSGDQRVSFRDLGLL
jgi:DNA repair protein RadC